MLKYYLIVSFQAAGAFFFFFQLSILFFYFKLKLWNFVAFWFEIGKRKLIS